MKKILQIVTKSINIKFLCILSFIIYSILSVDFFLLSDNLISRFTYFSFALILLSLIFWFMIFISKKNEKWVKWLIIIETIIICALSIYIFRSSYHAVYIYRADYMLVYQWQQTIAVLFLYLIGSILLWVLCENISPLKLGLYGFVIGCCLWVLLAGIMLFIGIPYNLFIVIIFLIFFFMIIFMIKRPKIPNKIYIKYYFVYTIIFLNCSLLFSFFHLGTFSYDSFQYLDYGLKLGQYGSFTSGMINGYIVSAYAIFLPIIDSISILFHYIDAHNIIQLIFINFLIIFLFELFGLIYNKKAKIMSFLFLLLSLLMLLSNGSFFTVGVWHINNGLTMSIMFLLAVFINLCIKSKDIGYSIICAILLSSLLFARIEMSLYCIILIILISTLDITKKQMYIIYTMPVITLLAYYIGYFSQFGTEIGSDFLTLSRAVPVLFIFVLFGLYLLFFWRKRLIKIQKKVFLIVITSMILLFIALSFFNLSRSIHNLQVISYHILFGRYSGYNWHFMLSVIPIITLLCFRKRTKKVPESYSLIALSFTLFILDIFLFRDAPLRHGTADSGNRLIMQLYPFLVFILFVKLSPLFLPEKNS